MRKARGVDQYKWDNVYKHVDDALRANPFYSCPLLELVYFCCPGLCFQFAICMLNPINWLCIFCPANQVFDSAEILESSVNLVFSGNECSTHMSRGFKEHLQMTKCNMYKNMRSYSCIA